VYLVALDMQHAVNSYRILLETIPYDDPDLYENLLATIRLSRDEAVAFIALTRFENECWVTSIVRADLRNNTASKPHPVVRAPALWGPSPTIALSPDEKSLFVARSDARPPALNKIYTTHITQVDLSTMNVVRTMTLPGEIESDSVWVQVETSPDGKYVYTFENIWRDAGDYEMRFSSLDLTDGKLLVSEFNHRSTNETGCDSRYYLMRGDANHAWQWCVIFVQYLDLQTGRIAEKVNLLDPLSGGSFAEYTLSQDGKTLYTAYPMERRVSVLDLTSRAVRTSPALHDRARLPDLRRALTGLFITTASAKGLARPAVALSRDEKWLAFVDLRDFTTVDGVWVVNTQTLEPYGHWLRGEEIVGVRSSIDGSQLHVLHRLTNELRTLDPETGNAMHTLKLPHDIYGFIADLQP
jgi:hypothetical protein